MSNKTITELVPDHRGQRVRCRIHGNCVSIALIHYGLPEYGEKVDKYYILQDVYDGGKPSMGTLIYKYGYCVGDGTRDALYGNSVTDIELLDQDTQTEHSVEDLGLPIKQIILLTKPTYLKINQYD